MTRRPKEPQKPRHADWSGRLLADVRNEGTVTTGRDARAVRPYAPRKDCVAGDPARVGGSRRTEQRPRRARSSEETQDGATA